MKTLLMPREVDRLLRYPRGRSVKLAKAGRLPHVVLPDGEIRFDEDVIQRLLTPRHDDTSAQEVVHA